MKKRQKKHIRKSTESGVILVLGLIMIPVAILLGMVAIELNQQEYIADRDFATLNRALKFGFHAGANENEAWRRIRLYLLLNNIQIDQTSVTAVANPPTGVSIFQTVAQSSDPDIDRVAFQIRRNPGQSQKMLLKIWRNTGFLGRTFRGGPFGLFQTSTEAYGANENNRIVFSIDNSVSLGGGGISNLLEALDIPVASSVNGEGAFPIQTGISDFRLAAEAAQHEMKRLPFYLTSSALTIERHPTIPGDVQFRPTTASEGCIRDLNGVYVSPGNLLRSSGFCTYPWYPIISNPNQQCTIQILAPEVWQLIGGCPGQFPLLSMTFPDFLMLMKRAIENFVINVERTASAVNLHSYSGPTPNGRGTISINGSTPQVLNGVIKHFQGVEDSTLDIHNSPVNIFNMSTELIEGIRIPKNYVNWFPVYIVALLANLYDTDAVYPEHLHDGGPNESAISDCLGYTCPSKQVNGQPRYKRFEHLSTEPGSTPSSPIGEVNKSNIWELINYLGTTDPGPGDRAIRSNFFGIDGYYQLKDSLPTEDIHPVHGIPTLRNFRALSYAREMMTDRFGHIFPTPWNQEFSSPLSPLSVLKPYPWPDYYGVGTNGDHDGSIISDLNMEQGAFGGIGSWFYSRLTMGGTDMIGAFQAAQDAFDNSAEPGRFVHVIIGDGFPDLETVNSPGFAATESFLSSSLGVNVSLTPAPLSDPQHDQAIAQIMDSYEARYPGTTTILVLFDRGNPGSPRSTRLDAMFNPQTYPNRYMIQQTLATQNLAQIQQTLGIVFGRISLVIRGGMDSEYQRWFNTTP